MQDKKCSVEGCIKKHRAKGYCANHYLLMRRNGSPIPTKTYHGMTNTTEFSCWSAMKRRILREPYRRKNIIVCERWRHSFLNFFNDMGKRPTTEHSIDRIDNNGSYCKENCRWATISEQQNNTSRNVFIEIKGRKKTVTQWCRIFAVNRQTAFWRIKTGWKPELAVSIKSRGRGFHPTILATSTATSAR